MCGEHFSEVLREGINMLLKEEKGGTDGTQLPFVNDKGELLHWVRIGLSAYPSTVPVDEAETRHLIEKAAVGAVW
jgi:hypothetical protein